MSLPACHITVVQPVVTSSREMHQGRARPTVRPSVARAEMSRRVHDSFDRLDRTNLSWRSVTNSRRGICVQILGDVMVGRVALP